jgi:hypothetical protein
MKDKQCEPPRRDGPAADNSWLWVSVNLPRRSADRKTHKERSNPPGTQIFKTATGLHFSRVIFGTRRGKGVLCDCLGMRVSSASGRESLPLTQP